MYDAKEHTRWMKERYGFLDTAYAIGPGGLTVALALTPEQIGMVNSKVDDKEAIIFRAEAYVCMNGMSTKAMLPETRISGQDNWLEITGAPSVIDLILAQLFDAAA